MSNLNPSDYVFSYSNNISMSAPYIQLDMYRVTSDELTVIQDNYMIEAENYKNSFDDLIGDRLYVQNRLMYDLSIETEYLTKEGVNKQTNTLDLHVKADNVFKVAKKHDLSSIFNITAIINNFEELNNSVVLSDDLNSSALVSSYATSCTYDTKAKSYTFTDLGALIFIKDIANSKGTGQTFTSYTSVLESGKYVNTAVYQLKYDEEFISYDEQGAEIKISVWAITDASGVIKYYTADDILTVENVSWVAFVVAEEPSSSNEEVIEEPSSSDEEVIEEPSSSDEEVIGE